MSEPVSGLLDIKWFSKFLILGHLKCHECLNLRSPTPLLLISRVKGFVSPVLSLPVKKGTKETSLFLFHVYVKQKV